MAYPDTSSASQNNNGTQIGNPAGADTGSETTPALEVKSLAAGFGSEANHTPVLVDVSLTVRQAEFVCLMGSSGCGKTTLLNHVAGFQSGTSGIVRVAGRHVAGAGPDRGVVFQKPALFHWLSVLDNVMFGPRAMQWNRAAARESAETLLEEVGLSGFEEHKVYEISGGMQHRVALARTLVMHPPVLLMDEPFAALDAQTRTEMQGLLLEVCARHNSTVLFVTHDIEEGLLLSDRVLVLSGRPASVGASYTVPFVRPRTVETVMEPDFVALRKEIRAMLTAA